MTDVRMATRIVVDVDPKETEPKNEFVADDDEEDEMTSGILA